MCVQDKRTLNKGIITNYNRVKISLLLLPLAMIVFVFILLYSKGVIDRESYVQVQKEYFYFLNAQLSQFPNIQLNLTQLGDAFIALSLLSIFIIYAPKLWEALITASIISAIFSRLLKELFSIPRPATIFDNDSFTIVGKTLVGYSSLPSGHSITTFTVLTVLLLSFMPRASFSKIVWSIFIFITGYVIAFTRVGVGAHHPLDVIIGSLVGGLSAILGVLICRRFPFFKWVGNRKFYPIFILAFLVGLFILADKISKTPLPIFYFTFISLIISLYVIIKTYLKK